MCDFSSLSLSPSVAFDAVWIIQQWYRASIWGQLKLCFTSCRELKAGLTANQSFLPFSNEVIWNVCVYVCEEKNSIPVTTVIDWQSLLSMSQLPVVMSNKTTALRRPTLHWDFFSHFAPHSFFSENLKIHVKKFIVWFSGWDYHFTFYDWWGILVFRILFLFNGISMCMFAYADNHYCRRQISFLKPQINHRFNFYWNAIILQQRNYVGMGEVRRIGFIRTCSDSIADLRFLSFLCLS